MSTDQRLEFEASEQLKRVQTVTDAALAHLTLERLLDELLTRVRDLLSADTAAVLLLDAAGLNLVATAAKGLEEEVYQRVRVPVGRGFAGSIAATGAPVIIEDIDETKVANPILLEKGLRSILGVPLVVQAKVIGVLHVGSLVPREFTKDDVHLLQLVADRVALAIEARVREGQSLTASTLQRALLPEDLPPLERVELAARYVPSEGGMVGGDWYDVFRTYDGTVCFAVGDVVGRGLEAAVVMARLRNAVRAQALEEITPGEMLWRLNRLLVHFDPGEMATTIYGTIEEEGVVHFANAGHIPPLLVRPQGESRYLERTVDPVLGASPGASYATHSTVLEPDSTLLLFTDGLVERRGTTLDEGFEVIAAAAVSAANKPLGRLCDELVAVGRAFSRSEDDLALLALRFQGWSPSDRIELTFDADPSQLPAIRGGLRRWLAGVDPWVLQDVLVSTSEAVANAVEHAYGSVRGKIKIVFRRQAGLLFVEVSDEGSWREPRGPDRGRGQILMQGLMNSVDVHTGAEGTTVRMTKSLDGPTH
jgi:serine phosphatase RsbU (regulator of sigma subunit)/anti-sigma regulatory factor (Ser/Thr protein kinase)